MTDLSRTLDLTTTYLGLKLRNPLVASASPMCEDVGNVCRMEDAGAAAVVLHSLFEEQINLESEELDRALSAAEELGPEASSHFPDMTGYNLGPDGYLNHIRKCKELTGIPIIASLNGASTGGWTDYASALQDAGAAAIELNIYYLPGALPPASYSPATSPPPFIAGSEVEQRHVEILSTVKAVVSVPVAVKLSPYFSSTGEIARRLDRAGADGLVLFNRFLQPDIDPETLTVTVRPGLSTQAEGRLPRAWIALLAGRVRASIAATTGVETAADVASYLLAGADVVMTASALLRHGPGYAAVLLGELSDWMARKGFGSLAEVRGLLAVPDSTDQAAYERAGYVTALEEANKGYGPW